MSGKILNNLFRRFFRRTPIGMVTPISIKFLVGIGSLALFAVLVIIRYKSLADNLMSITAIASAIIALLALSFSFVTFQSIDTVSVISKMEGNVLENNHYIKNIIGLIGNFEKGTYGSITKQEEAIEAFLSQLNVFEEKRQKVTSGTLLADELQFSIDFVPLMAFLMINPNRYEDGNSWEKARTKIVVRYFRNEYYYYIKSLSEYLEELEKNANGSIRVLREAVSLIEATSKYQFAQNLKFWSNQEIFKEDAEQSYTAIMTIDSNLLRNASCRCLYFKYLGLCYLNSSLNMLPDSRNIDIDNLIKARERYLLMDSEKQYFIQDNLGKAKDCFSKVIELADNDMFWKTIYFDLARVEFYQTWFGNNPQDKDMWKHSMKKAIENRFRLVCNLNQALCNRKNQLQYDKQNPIEEETSYFRAAMIEQYHQAVLFDITFRMLIEGDEDENKRLLFDDFSRLPKERLPQRSRTFDKDFQKLRSHFNNKYMNT
jgi:hypothetical protein